MLHVLDNKVAFLLAYALLSLTSCLVKSASQCSRNSLNKEEIICKNVQYIKDIRSAWEKDWTHLSIVNDEIKQLEWNDNLEELLNLESLDLSHVGELILDENGFGSLTNLKFFNVSNCKLESVKNKFLNDANMVNNLDASWNSLGNLNFDRKNKFPSLEVANFSHNQIQTVDTENALTKLKILHLDFNELKSLSLHDHINLNVLTMSENLIEKLTTNSFGNLPALEELVITACPLSEIEGGAFESMLLLKNLNLSANSLKYLPTDVFVGLNRLIQLDLSSNNLEELAQLQFQHLVKLQYLDVSRNSLKALNASHFNSLTNLRKLFLYENDIEEIGPNTFSNLRSLDTLDLSYNNLVHLDGEVFGANTLPRLRKLILKSNSLKNLHPLAFASLPFLQYLSLGANELSSLDVRMFAPLRRLEKLHLGNNLIETITSDVLESLTDVKELLLDNNRLSFLSDSKAAFTYLEKVSLEGNPWQCPCWDDVTNYLEKRGISYVRHQSPYFRGQKPLCVVTPVAFCVKDIKLVKEHKIEEIYNSG